jgi:hypothetical protein
MAATREQMLSRYRHLRAINRRQQSDALHFVSQSTMLDCARRVGLARGRTLMLDNETEMTFVFDLAVHTAMGGRSRAIDRYADRNPPLAGSDDALMLAAARKAHFAIWVVESRHEAIGLHITDIFSREQLWLIDEALEASHPLRRMFASRLMAIDDFVMTCGAIAPIDELVLLETLRSIPHALHASRTDAVQDPRLAAAIFRGAIRTGITKGVRFVDPTAENLQEAMHAG